MEAFIRRVRNIKASAKAVINTNLNFILEFQVLDFYFKIFGQY